VFRERRDFPLGMQSDYTKPRWKMPWDTLLTTEEERAAEAAFHGDSPNPRWTRRARSLYDAIIALTNGRDVLEPGIVDGTRETRIGA